MQRNNEIAKKCEDNLASVLGLAMHFLKIIRFDRKNPQQLYSVCLYCRLVEIAWGCNSLLESKTLVAIPILLRSMFEADIDLTNLTKKQDYHKHMYASFLKEKLKITKAAASDETNPFLTSIREFRLPNEDLNEIDKEISQLKSEKFDAFLNP